MPKEANRRWWVSHSGSIYYPSTRTGKMVEAPPRRIIDDLPAQGMIDGVSGPNWLITEGLVQPYKGDKPTGTLIPQDEISGDLYEQMHPVVDTVETILPFPDGVAIVLDQEAP